MITVHENAVKYLKEILSADGAKKGDGLRLLVERGGCAGMQYGMKIDNAADGDEVIESEGVRLYVDRNSLKFLHECEIQYSDDLTDTGLKIVNPNAARSCGTSFEPSSEGGDTAEGDEVAAEEIGVTG